MVGLWCLLWCVCGCCSLTIRSSTRVFGFHSRLSYEVETEPADSIRCLFVWHRLPAYVELQVEEVARLKATVIGRLQVDSMAVDCHPLAYCFVLYNSSTTEMRGGINFWVTLQFRYLETSFDADYHELVLGQPVVHWTRKGCPLLGEACPAPKPDTALEIDRQLTAIIPLGQEKHFALVCFFTCLFSFVGCSSLFVISGKATTSTSHLTK